MLIDFHRAKQLVPWQSVLDLAGWSPREIRGRQLRGKCPFHHSSNPKSRSFAVHLDEGWYCHSCRVGGDQFAFWSRLHGLTAYQAALDLLQAIAGYVPTLPSQNAERRRGTVKGGDNG